MEAKTCKFLIGLGIGSVLGALSYHFARTRQAKELKNRVCDAINRMGNKANEVMEEMKETLAEAEAKARKVGKE
ncbi:MAG: YtxH domain-containing protein [Bacteroides sp.]|nr:YtxH domain-containing protein [Bacteroides sp.]